MLRSKFLAAVAASLLPLSTLLCALCEGRWEVEGREMVSEGRWEVERSEVWRLIEVIAKVQALERSGGDYSVHCQVLSNLLSSFFSCLSQTTCLLKQGEAYPACSGACTVLCGMGYRRQSGCEGRDESWKMCHITGWVGGAIL